MSYTAILKQPSPRVHIYSALPLIGIALIDCPGDGGATLGEMVENYYKAYGAGLFNGHAREAAERLTTIYGKTPRVLPSK